MLTINVVKRDGTKQPLDLDRFHKVVQFACDGYKGVSASEIELKSHIQFTNNIKTSTIQETLIKAAADLISEETPNYQYVAGRLINYHLRKEVYGQYEPVHLYDHVKKLVKKKLYDKQLLDWFTVEEFNQLNDMIDHKRDELLTYVAMEQFRGKYLVKDRTTGAIYETPQMVYLLVAATLFARYPKETRMKWIKEYYDAISTHEISIPTPVIAGVRTDERQFASCVLVKSGDSLDSIIATTGIIVKYISARAGLGIHGGPIRSLGSSVKQGTRSHTGKVPFWRMMQDAVKSCSQGGLRGGSATMNYHFFDLEVESLLPLKNSKGTEETRLRQLDYCIHLNKLFLQRYISGGNITLFSPHDIPEVMKAFYSNSPDFEELYVAAEKRPFLRKAVVSAKHLMDMIVEERVGTGRLYIMFVDHANDHSSFIADIAPIEQTNLCVEITLPTGECNDLNDPNGEVALCILSALNMGTTNTKEDIERVTRLQVRGLDALIDYQDYQVAAARNATLKRRPLGNGVVNLAYWMAKNNMTYSNPDLDKIDEYMEYYTFNLIKASMELAKENGPCPGFNETKYSQGIFPIDTYKKDVDLLTSRKPTCDWDWLRGEVVMYGMANSTLMAGMPGETSSQVANATSGVDPVRDIVTYKQSKDGVMAQVAPEARRLKNKYETLWNMPNTRGLLSVMAVIQKWFDQSISTNTSYNPANYPDGIVPDSEIIGDILYAYKYGVKTLYYNNILAIADEDDTQEECEGCAI